VSYLDETNNSECDAPSKRKRKILRLTKLVIEKAREVTRDEYRD
jgi:hypothetical protein